MAADKGSAGFHDMLLCLEDKGYFRVGWESHMGKACHASAGVPTELIEVAIAVSGWVDPADSDVVFKYLEHYFMGSQWGYWQPEVTTPTMPSTS